MNWWDADWTQGNWWDSAWWLGESTPLPPPVVPTPGATNVPGYPSATNVFIPGYASAPKRQLSEVPEPITRFTLRSEVMMKKQLERIIAVEDEQLLLGIL